MRQTLHLPENHFSTLKAWKEYLCPLLEALSEKWSNIHFIGKREKRGNLLKIFGENFLQCFTERPALHRPLFRREPGKARTNCLPKFPFLLSNIHKNYGEDVRSVAIRK